MDRIVDGTICRHSSQVKHIQKPTSKGIVRGIAALQKFGLLNLDSLTYERSRELSATILQVSHWKVLLKITSHA